MQADHFGVFPLVDMAAPIQPLLYSVATGRVLVHARCKRLAVELAFERKELTNIIHTRSHVIMPPRSY